MLDVQRCILKFLNLFDISHLVISMDLTMLTVDGLKLMRVSADGTKQLIFNLRERRGLCYCNVPNILTSFGWSLGQVLELEFFKSKGLSEQD